MSAPASCAKKAAACFLEISGDTMSPAHTIPGRLARRPRRAAARLLASAVASLLLATHGARAQDMGRSSRSPSPLSAVWVCSDHKGSPHDGRPPLELEMKDGLLIERPLGSPRYRLLADNAFAIIAVDHFADFEPVLGMVNIFVSTMTIDKTTGNFAMTTIVSDKVLEPRTGKCRMFEQQAAGDKVLAQKR
jgi:hypothetical protein